MAFEIEEFDLVKARPHKYVKRTGTPGNYRYWYKLPDGRIVEGDDEGQKAGRKEHLIRLLIARAKGKHSMSNAEIIEHTGYHRDAAGETDAQKRGKALHNLRGFLAHAKRTGKRKLQAKGEEKRDAEHAISLGHDFDDHHLDEAHHHDTESEEYRNTHRDGENHTAHASPVRARTRPARRRVAEEIAALPERPRRTRRQRAADAQVEAQSRPRTAVEATIEEAEQVEQRQNQRKIEELRAKLAENFGINLGEDREEEPLVPGMAEDIEAANSEPDERSAMAQRLDNLAEQFVQEQRRPSPQAPGATTESSEDFQRRLDEAYERGRREAAAESHADRAAREAQARIDEGARRARAKEAARRAKALASTIGPDAPAAREMAAADPTFAADEAPIREAIKRQNAGKNPYLERAKEIFERIAPHIPEKNRMSFQHFLVSIQEASSEWPVGIAMTEERAKGLYEEGRTRDMLTWAALKTAMPTYKGLYHDLSEILGNEPLNPEVERMKRGYARKQFERMRPYIKDQWHLSNPDAPPPFPTFGDLKSWNEFGTRPEWAAPRAQLAVPKEVHDASPKDQNGKVQLPPRWMPIHLQPLWNYASKIRADYTANPSPNEVSGSSLNLDMGRDLGSQIMNSLRKYVQARGGASQLVDIPASKLRSVGLSHNDIFKSIKDHDYTDKTMQKILTTKIIDPVAVAPFVEAELEASKKVKKSWSLVADIKLPGPKVEEALVKSEAEKAEELRKSRLIEAIKAKKNKLGRLGIRG